MFISKFNAIKIVYPNAESHTHRYETNEDRVKDSDGNLIVIDDALVQAALDKLQAEYVAQDYVRNRQNDYPDWSIQLNKIYDDGLTKWKSEMVDPVKAKWPKDNSGPVE